MKKLLSVFLTSLILVTVISMMSFSSSAIEGYVSPAATAYKTTSAITVDGNMSEWGKVPCNYFSYQDFSGENSGDTLITSDNSYYKILYDNNNIYIAAVISDATLETADTNPGRDWFKVAVNLDGIAAANTDPATRAYTVSTLAGDGWFPKSGEIPLNWEGYNSSVSGNAFQSGDMKIVNDGTNSYVECVYQLNDNLKNRLIEGTKIGVGVKYEDYLVKHDDHDPVNRRYLWGDDSFTFYDDISKLGTVTLGGEIVEDVVKTAPSFTAKKATGEIIVDADLGEWKNVPKTTVGFYDFTGDNNGETLNDSDGSYFQVVYDSKKIYVAAAVTDQELQTADGAPGRDWFKMIFDLDGSATTHVDTNTRALTITTLASDGWFPQDGTAPYNWEGYASANNGNAFKNGSMKLLWKDGVTYMESSFDVNDALVDRLTAGSKFGFGFKYEDYLVKHDDHDPINRRYLWGDDNYTFLDDISKMGIMELSGDEVSMEQPIVEQDPVVVDESEDAPANKDIVVLDNGDRQISWNSAEGAVGYKVNLFARFEAVDGTNYFYIQTKDTADLSTTLTYLDEDADYTYQVLALDGEGNVIAAYAPADFSTATVTEPAAEATPTIEAEESSEDNSTVDDNVNTGDPLNVIGILVVLGLLSVIVVTMKTKKTEM